MALRVRSPAGAPSDLPLIAAVVQERGTVKWLAHRRVGNRDAEVPNGGAVFPRCPFPPCRSNIDPLSSLAASFDYEVGGLVAAFSGAAK